VIILIGWASVIRFYATGIIEPCISCVCRWRLR